MGTLTNNLNLYKTDMQTDGDDEFDFDRDLNDNWNKIDYAFNKIETRNIGEIITSTVPLKDAGLHLADGSLLQYGLYSAFIDHMAELSTSNPNLFCTEAQWQESVTKYGVCEKYVYDSENKTVRLPKITGFVEGSKDLCYIVIATSTKTDIQVNIDNIATDLNGKTDKDLNNITQPAKELITSFSVPDYNKGILGPALNTSRTVPYDALITVEANINKTHSGLLFYLRNPDGLYISLAHPAGTNEKMYFIGSNQGTSQLAIIPLWVTIPKGFTYHIECGSPPTTYRIKEYPLKGASNE